MFKLVIPTYKRYNIPTLAHLGMFDDIYIFVANQQEYNKYRVYYPNYKIIIGELGIKNQRNFITNYFDDGDIIVSLDDDIKSFNDRQNRLLIDAVKDCVEYLKQSDYGLMTFPPTQNQRFNNTKSFTIGDYLCVGVFHIYKNDKSLQLSIDFIEDYERSLLYIKRDGAVIRNWDITYKHKPYNIGGLEEMRTKDTLLLEINKFLYKYPNDSSFHYKKDLPHIIFKYNKTPVVKLPKTDIFNDLISLLEIAKLRSYRDTAIYGGDCGNRRGFPAYKGGIFGIVQQRKSNIKCLSSMSKDQPVLYNEILRCGRAICPFDFTMIQLNKNLCCPPHKDSKNAGYSMLVSIGDYVGGEVVIDGKEYDARENPLVFNGAELEHYNKPIISGTKYSLVFF